MSEIIIGCPCSFNGCPLKSTLPNLHGASVGHANVHTPCCCCSIPTTGVTDVVEKTNIEYKVAATTVVVVVRFTMVLYFSVSTETKFVEKDIWRCFSYPPSAVMCFRVRVKTIVQRLGRLGR